MQKQFIIEHNEAINYVPQQKLLPKQVANWQNNISNYFAKAKIAELRGLWCTVLLDRNAYCIYRIFSQLILLME
jgi:hypothetical protein